MNDPVLAFDALRKRFGKQEVLAGISTSVQRGEVVGLLGLNGSGKTTLLECALGYSLPNGGNSRLFGHDSAALDTATRTRIGFVPQRDELLDAMNAAQYLDLIADFYPHWNRTLIQRLQHEWEVPGDKRIGALSIGQRQRLSIISALGHEPELLVLDEPVASLDPVARRLFLKELVDIASSQRRSIVLSTHIVSDLERVATRVWLLQGGRISVDSELDLLKEHIVRLHLPAGTPLPEVLAGQVLNTREQNGVQIVLCRDWTHESGVPPRWQADAGVLVEPLSLEEIFLELHA